MKQMNEQMRLRRLEDQAERYFKKFRPQMESLSKSVLIKSKGGRLSAADVYALGTQLELFEAHKEMLEEDGTLNLLGKIPTVAYDVITAVQGASVIPAIASVQPIEDERGLVYFKNVKAQTTRGSITAGDTLTDPRLNVKTPTGYSSGVITGEVLGTGDGAETTFSGTLDVLPVKAESLVITLEGSTTVEARDFGNGQLYGKGVSGTIDYATGAFSLTFTAAPTNGADIYAQYQQNFEGATNLPEINSFFDSKTISAQVYALKGTIGLLQSFAMKKRFGLIADEEIAKDLVQEINKEIGGDLIRKIFAAAVSDVNWYKTPQTGVSYFEHKQSFKDALADAEANLNINSGRGTISVILAGAKAAAIIQTLPGFVKLTDGNTLGAHIFGTLDGATVIRVSETALVNQWQTVCLWKGTSPFETCAVYAPFMPLTVTDALPQSLNPLQRARAAAVFAGVDVVVPQYATKLTVVD